MPYFSSFISYFKFRNIRVYIHFRLTSSLFSENILDVLVWLKIDKWMFIVDTSRRVLLELQGVGWSTVCLSHLVGFSGSTSQHAGTAAALSCELWLLRSSRSRGNFSKETEVTIWHQWCLTIHVMLVDNICVCVSSNFMYHGFICLCLFLHFLYMMYVLSVSLPLCIITNEEF